MCLKGTGTILSEIFVMRNFENNWTTCIFIIGDAGVGKFNWIKAIHLCIYKLLMHKWGDSEKLLISLLPLRKITAINIDGTTIYPALEIKPEGGFTQLSDSEIIIIDEISLVPSTLIFQVSHTLIGTFGCLYNKTFPKLQVNVCGDLYQLPPVKGFAI